jgi:hypothetical protein
LELAATYAGSARQFRDSIATGSDFCESLWKSAPALYGRRRLLKFRALPATFSQNRKRGQAFRRF